MRGLIFMDMWSWPFSFTVACDHVHHVLHNHAYMIFMGLIFATSWFPQKLLKLDPSKISHCKVLSSTLSINMIDHLRVNYYSLISAYHFAGLSTIRRILHISAYDNCSYTCCYLRAAVLQDSQNHDGSYRFLGSSNSERHFELDGKQYRKWSDNQSTCHAPKDRTCVLRCSYV